MDRIGTNYTISGIKMKEMEKIYLKRYKNAEK